jgi:hypothetical protein
MLKKQLGEQDSALVFKFISDNHYLSGLASRPFLLNKIAFSLDALYWGILASILLKTADAYP